MKSKLRFDLARSSRFSGFLQNRSGLKIASESLDLCNMPIRVKETGLHIREWFSKVGAICVIWKI